MPVAGCLVEHINKIAVLEDILNFPAGQQILDVLGDACGYTTPFSEPLPDLDAVCCRLFLFQQEVKLVYIVPGVLFAVAVDGNTVPDLILDDEHPQFFQLFAQLFDIETDNAVIQFHIGLVVEHPQRTVDVDFQCRGDTLRLPLFLLPQAVVQIAESRHILRLRVVQILLVDQRQATVNDRLFLWLHTIPCAHDEFAQGKNKVRFHAQRVIIVRVIEVDVHWVDVVLTGGRDMNDLSAQCFHQRIILALRVCHDNIVRCGEKHVRDFTLCTE